MTVLSTLSTQILLYQEEEKIRQKYVFFKRIGYYPTPIQNKVHKSLKRFVVWAGGARSGKSMSAGYEGAYKILRFADFRTWIVGTQYELAEKEFGWAIDALGKYRIGESRKWDPDGRPFLDFCRVSDSAKGSKSIITPYGSFLKTKSTEKPQTLLGEELNLIILAEASQIPKTIWSRQLRFRIGPRKGGVFAFSTPNDDGGLFKDFRNNVEKKKLKDWDFFQSSVLENTYFPREEYEQMRETMAEKDFAEQADGKFVSRRGLIFEPEIWSDSVVDCVPAFVLDYANFEDLPVLAGVHKGFKNPAFVVYARFLRTEEGKIFLFVYKAKQYREHRIEEIIHDVLGESAGKPFRGCLLDLFDSHIIEEFRASPLLFTTNDEEKKIGRQMAIQKRIQGVSESFQDKRLYILKINDTKDLTDCLEQAKWNELNERDKEKGKMESEIPNSIFMQGVFALSHVASFVWSTSYKWYGR